MHLDRRQFTAFAMAALCVSSARAQSGKPIRLVVPFAPGGSNDIVGRVVANQLGPRINRSVVVDNRPGAGGMIGSDMVARAEPDGTTLLLISSTFTMNASVMPLAYDPNKAFVSVAMLGSGPSLIAVPATLPVHTIPELVEYSKKNPGKVVFGSAGMASFQHFAIELFKQRTGADLTVIHYKGGGPALVDLAAGHIQVSLGSLIQMLPLLKAGKIRAIGIAGTRRSELLPEVPTLIESGVKDYEASNWWGILAPAGTPAALLEQLHRETNAVLQDPEIQKRFAAEGAEPMPMSRDEFQQLMKRETVKWAKVAKETGIKPE
jgi:tripartite-type tricarboxylate transporter receptor subunit TctC